MKTIRKSLFGILAILMLFCMSLGAMAAESDSEEGASIVATIPVTKVLNGGEALVGIRIEFSEEVPVGEVRYDVYAQTFSVRLDREIDYMYISDTGEWGDVATESGKYCFIQFSESEADGNNYQSGIVFNEAEMYRPVIQFYMTQNADIYTVNGNLIEGEAMYIQVSSRDGEMRLGIDDFIEIPYVDEETGTELYVYLYIPEDEEDGPYPLIAHFPAGDSSYTEWDGGYRGALFTHNDCLVWASDEVQSINKAYVMTVGTPDGSEYTADIAIRLIDSLIDEYNIDTSRIYGVSVAHGAAVIYDIIAQEPNMFAAIISAAINIASTLGDDYVELYGNVLDNTASWAFQGGNIYTRNGTKYDTLGDYSLYESLVEDMADAGHVIAFTYDDDRWNGMLEGQDAAEQAREQIQQAEEAGTDDLATVYLPYTMKGMNKWVWNECYNNPGVWEWLFDQVSDTPYEG